MTKLSTNSGLSKSLKSLSCQSLVAGPNFNLSHTPLIREGEVLITLKICCTKLKSGISAVIINAINLCDHLQFYHQNIIFYNWEQAN